LRSRRKRKPCEHEHERDKEESAPKRRAVYRTFDR
jgi:hypothetical protein